MTPLPPGPTGLPFVGSLFSMMKSPDKCISDIARQYGDICSFNIGQVKTVVISHPKLLREAFSRPELSDKWVSEVMSLFSHGGKALGPSPYGERWRKLQRIIHKNLLVNKRLQQFKVQYMEAEVASMLDAFSDQSRQQRPINPYEIFSKANARIIFRCIFGRGEDDTAEIDGISEQLLETVRVMFRYATEPNPGDFFPVLKNIPFPLIKKVKKHVHTRDTLVLSLIRSARQYKGLNLDNPTTMLEVLLAEERDKNLTEEDILLLIGDMFIGGTDTSAQTLTWLLLLLANRPEILAKIHQEIDQVLGPNHVIAWEDRDKLPYCNAVLLESMRYKTISPFAAPHKASKDVLIGGYHIPRGAQVLGNLKAIHHDKRFWDRPDVFLPERFLPLSDGGDSPELDNIAFMPFSVGRRACPGVQFGEAVLWIQMSRFLQQFTFKASSGTSGLLPEEEIFGMTVAPKYFTLDVSERSNFNYAHTNIASDINASYTTNCDRAGVGGY